MFLVLFTIIEIKVGTTGYYWNQSNCKLIIALFMVVQSQYLNEASLRQ